MYFDFIGVSHMRIKQFLNYFSGALIIGLNGLYAIPGVATDSLQKADLAQNFREPLPAPSEAGSSSKQPLPNAFAILDGTPIKLKFKDTISSKTAKANDTILFEVTEAVRIGSTVVIPVGSTATGVVSDVDKGRMLGRRGKLEIAIKTVQLTSGERVLLRGQNDKGGGLSGGVMAAAAIVTPLFLLMGGSNVKIEAGTALTAYVDGDYLLDPKKFELTK